MKEVTFASAVCLIKDNRLLLVKQASTARHADKWGPPAGRREKEESFLETAERELEEEVDLKGLKLHLYEIAIWDDENKTSIVAVFKTSYKGKSALINTTDLDKLVWATKEDIKNDKYHLRDLAFKEILLRAFTSQVLPHGVINFYHRNQN